MLDTAASEMSIYIYMENAFIRIVPIYIQYNKNCRTTKHQNVERILGWKREKGEDKSHGEFISILDP